MKGSSFLRGKTGCVSEWMRCRVKEASSRPRQHHAPKPVLADRTPRSRSPVPSEGGMATNNGKSPSMGGGGSQDPFSVGDSSWSTAGPPPAYNSIHTPSQGIDRSTCPPPPPYPVPNHALFVLSCQRTPPTELQSALRLRGGERGRVALQRRSDYQPSLTDRRELVRGHRRRQVRLLPDRLRSNCRSVAIIPVCCLSCCRFEESLVVVLNVSCRPRV